MAFTAILLSSNNLACKLAKRAVLSGDLTNNIFFVHEAINFSLFKIDSISMSKHYVHLSIKIYLRRTINC